LKAKIHSASYTLQRFRSKNVARRSYNQWSVLEQSKFEQEIRNLFTKYAFTATPTNTKNTNCNTDDSATCKATMTVVTLVLLVGGLNRINNMQMPQSRSDLIALLESIAALDNTSATFSSQHLLGAEILWTPEDRSETLTKQHLMTSYPELTIL
jgi:uncharacterized membrane protein